MNKTLIPLVFFILLYSCEIVERHNKWVINSIHTGIVINGYGPVNSLTILDSGEIYHCTIDRDMWTKIQNGDTITHFK